MAELDTIAEDLNFPFPAIELSSAALTTAKSPEQCPRRVSSVIANPVTTVAIRASGRRRNDASAGSTSV